MQIVLEDVTDSADTLAGEAKVKVSVKGIDGSLTLSQLKFEFSGEGTFKAISYSDEINQLVKSSGSGQPFYVQPVDGKTANRDGKFDFAFSGGAKYSLPVSADGTELCTVTFEGEPEKDITLVLNDLENSFCVISPDILAPKTHAAEAVSKTVKFSNTTNAGVKATVNVILDELKEIGGFSDSSDVTLKFTNLENNQIRTFQLSDAEKTDVVSYKFEINGLSVGKYDIELSGNGFVSKGIYGTSLTSDQEFTISSDHFYAGDVTADSKLTLRDYNRFVSMYDAKVPVFSGVDYNHDGKLSEDDLFAMVTALNHHIEADVSGNIKASLKAESSSETVKKDDTFTVTLTLDAGSESVNSYCIKGTYPQDIAVLTKAECVETADSNKVINTMETGSFTLLNRVSDGSKKEIYTLTFKAVKAGTFQLNFVDAEGALLYDASNAAEEQLLNITAESDSVTVTSPSEYSGGGGRVSKTPAPSVSPSASPTPASPAEDKHEAYVSGYEDNTIRPDNTITRAEAAAMISRISSDFDSSQTYDVSMFTDIAEDVWYAKNVGYAAQKGFVKGYEDGSFRPDESITREEFVTMIFRFMNDQVMSGESFPDVPDSHWAKPYIDTMKAKGLISGYEDGTFGLGKQIIRAEVIVIINQTQGRIPNGDKIVAYIEKNGYPARDIEGHWAAAHIIEAVCGHEVSQFHE